MCVYVCVHACMGARVHVYKLGVVFVVVSFIYSGFVVIFKIELKYGGVVGGGGGGGVHNVNCELQFEQYITGIVQRQ